MTLQDNYTQLPPGLDRMTDASSLPHVAQTVPQPAPQRRTYLQDATREMKLTPQEQYLYGIHLQNLQETNGGIPAEDKPGFKHSLLQIDYQNPRTGRVHNIPSVWGGKVHTEDEAIAHAIEAGLDKFPHYPSRKAALARYMKMHGYMERDMNEWAK